jgi:hypothetical protein
MRLGLFEGLGLVVVLTLGLFAGSWLVDGSRLGLLGGLWRRVEGTMLGLVKGFGIGSVSFNFARRLVVAVLDIGDHL